MGKAIETPNRAMDSDVDVLRWVLELLLRDRDKHSFALQALDAAEPLSNQYWLLKKTALLRTIDSQIFDEASVTETILDSLESIEVLDRAHQILITDSMKAAYCAVATDCTVKFLVCDNGKPGRKYKEAVDRIWRGRVRALEESEGCELVSATLNKTRDEVEAGISDIKVSKKLASMNSRNDALRLVAVYVKEALALLGPPFIAWAVRFNMQEGGLGAELGDGSKLELNVHDGSELELQKGANVNSGSEQVADASEPDSHDSNVGDESESPTVTVAYLNSMSGVGHHTMNGVQLQIVGEERSPPNGIRGVLSFEPTKEKETPRSSTLRRRHGPVKIRDAGDVGAEASADGYNIVSSAECRKVKEQLRSSVLALKAVVTDPLPHALRVSEIVRSELGMRHVDHTSGENVGTSNPSVEKNSAPDQSNNDDHGNQTSHQNDVPQPSGEENGAPNLSVDKERGTGYVQTGHVNPGNPSRSFQNIVSGAGLMERNSSAHTYEWDDSLGMSPERTNSNGRPHLASPKRKAVSPLKKFEDKRVAKRRKVKRWSLYEEDTLRTGVQKYGKGNWKFILDTYQDVFEERTEVDLKDKWRNMTK